MPKPPRKPRIRRSPLVIEGLTLRPGYKLVPDDFDPSVMIEVPVKGNMAAQVRESYRDMLAYREARDARHEQLIAQREAKAKAIVQAKMQATLKSNAKPGERSIKLGGKHEIIIKRTWRRF